MADRAISELTAVTGVNAEDSFVLQQNNRAMRLTGQVLLNWLAVALDGHGGIKSIAKTNTSVLTDTYTITFADETSETFTVTNGRSIDSVSKTSSSGLVDTYTIQYNDGTSSAFEVGNGKGIDRIVKTETVGLTDTYTVYYTDGTNSVFTVKNGEKGDQGDSMYTYIRYSANSPTKDSDMHLTPDNWMGVYCGVSSSAPTSYQDYQWFEIKGQKGDHGDDAAIVQQVTEYQNSVSGETIPTGDWTETQPATPQGQFLWIRHTISWDGGGQTVLYFKSYMGINGSGSVSSVSLGSQEPVLPDASGNVVLPVDSVPTANSNNLVASGGVADGLGGKISKAGDTMTGDLNIAKASSPGVYLKKSTGSDPVGALASVVDGDDNNRLVLRQRADSSAGDEGYFLPAPDDMSSSESYEILTSKHPVTVAQGGTGAGTAEDARTNLGLGSVLQDVADLSAALSNVKIFTKSIAANNGTWVFTFSGSCSFQVLTNGADDTLRSNIWAYCTGSGSVSATKDGAGSTSKITLTTSATNKLTITNASSYTCFAVAIIYGNPDNVSAN